MIKKNNLSLVLATFNEQENIGRCLEAIADITDEIIVVDGSSTDKTREIAKIFGAKVVKTTNPPIFHINKQKGLDLAKGKWILQLDADEVVSKDLKQEILQVTSLDEAELNSYAMQANLAKLFSRHQKLIEARDHVDFDKGKLVAGFFIPRDNMFLGKALKHGGVYPDPAIRLIRNGHAHFPCKSVHELIEVEGRVKWLSSSLLHYDSPTFSRYISRANRYTSLTAQTLRGQRVPKNAMALINYLLVKPTSDFLMRLFIHKAFLDGAPGLIFAFFSALHHPIAYLKYWEMK